MSDYIPDWDAPSPATAATGASFIPDWDAEPTKASPLPAGVQPSNAGGGRGGQGGPSFDQAQLYQSGRSKPISGLTGLAKGATLGLSKYVTAGEAYLADNARALMKGNPGMTWDQALQYTKQEMDAHAQNNPGAFYGGQAAGTVLNAAATGGATVPQLMARGAIQGGVSGFSDNENLKDAATGAVIGGATGGAVGTIAKGASAVKNAAVDKLYPYAEKYLGKGLTTVYKPFQDKVEELAVKYGINPGAENAYKMLGSVATSGEKAELNALATKAANTSPVKAMAVQNAKDFASGAFHGGATGAALSAMTGGDPVTGAIYGAGLGGGGKMLARKAGEVMAPYAARQVMRSSVARNVPGMQPAPSAVGQYVSPEFVARLGTSAATAAPGTLKEANQSLFDLLSQ